MRRILALAAVSGLAITGLTGTPAAADSTIQDVANVVINEAAVDLTEVTQFNINYIELKNTTGSPVDVTGWTIKSCAADGSVLGQTVLPDLTIIPANGFYLAGDDNYDMVTPFPNRDVALDGTNGDGLDNSGGVAFLDTSSVTDHSVAFGSPGMALLGCLQSGDFSPEVSSSSPTTSQTVQRFISGSGVVSWSLATRTPRAAN